MTIKQLFVYDKKQAKPNEIYWLQNISRALSSLIRTSHAHNIVFIMPMMLGRAQKLSLGG